MLSGADPRVAIRVAYGTLLDGLALIGLPRKPQEGPDEHMERCLRAADLPAGPIRELLRLFALARFSVHPITEEHRSQAIAALDTAIAASAGSRSSNEDVDHRRRRSCSPWSASAARGPRAVRAICC